MSAYYRARLAYRTTISTRLPARARPDAVLALPWWLCSATGSTRRRRPGCCVAARRPAVSGARPGGGRALLAVTTIAASIAATRSSTGRASGTASARLTLLRRLVLRAVRLPAGCVGRLAAPPATCAVDRLPAARQASRSSDRLRRSARAAAPVLARARRDRDRDSLAGRRSRRRSAARPRRGLGARVRRGRAARGLDDWSEVTCGGEVDRSVVRSHGAGSLPWCPARRRDAPRAAAPARDASESSRV